MKSGGHSSLTHPLSLCLLTHHSCLVCDCGGSKPCDFPRRSLGRERWDSRLLERNIRGTKACPPLCTDRVVVKSTAVVQGLGAELWAGAEKQERLQSEL